MKVGVLASEIGDPLSVNPTSEFCDSGLTGGCQLEGFSVGIGRPKREPPSGDHRRDVLFAVALLLQTGRSSFVRNAGR